jgi:ABC-type thiamine transport system substrate-binding protein
LKKVGRKKMSSQSTKLTVIALSASLFLATAATAAEKATVKEAVKEAVKDPKGAAQKVIPKQVKKEAGTAGATAAAAKAFEKASSELYPKAKQEGNLIVYSVWDVEHLRVVTEAFMKRYPGIKATYWQGRNPEIVTRALTEFQGGQSSFDVVLSDNAPPVIRAAGAIMNYETVQKDVLYLHDPTMPTVSLQVQALAFNTKKMKLADAPKTWEDVANPKFKSLVALDDPMRAGPLSSMLAALKTQWKDDERFNKFLRGLKALGVPVHKSTSAMFRLVISRGDTQGNAGELRQDKSAGIVSAASRYLREGAESEHRQTVRGMADFRGRAEDHRFNRPRNLTQRLQVEDLC